MSISYSFTHIGFWRWWDTWAPKKKEAMFPLVPYPAEDGARGGRRRRTTPILVEQSYLKDCSYALSLSLYRSHTLLALNLFLMSNGTFGCIGLTAEERTFVNPYRPFD